MGTIRKLIHNVVGIAEGVWNFLTTIWGLIVNFKQTALSMIGDIESLIANAESEFVKIRDFAVDPKWNTRVISVPRALPAIQDFLSTVPLDIVDKVRDIVQLFKQKINATEFDLGELDFLPEKFVTFLEKILGWAALIVDSLVTIDQGVKDLNAIVNDIRQIREQIEGFDALFLPQGTIKRVQTVTYRKRQSV